MSYYSDMEMDVSRHIEYWRESSREDLVVATELLQKRRSRHALFFAEVAPEKMIKALVVQRTSGVPPKSHDLLRLADLAGIDLPEERRLFLARFQEYNLEGRYPERLPHPPSVVEAESLIDECRETIEWLTTLFG